MSEDWTISASKLKTVEECPQQFKLKYLEGHRGIGFETRWIRRGNAVHETIEHVLNSEEYDPESSADLKAAYRNLGGPEAWTLSEDFHEQVLACFDAAARAFRKLVDDVRGVELEVEFGVDRPDVTRDFGGFMDLATDDAVIDWKTGKSEGKDVDEALQGAVYMAGYYWMFQEPPEAIHYAYLNPEAGDDHPKVKTIEPDDDLWEMLVGRARKLLARIEDDDFEADPGPDVCEFCEVEPFCPASPVGAGRVPWEVYP